MISTRQTQPTQPMKTKQILAVLTILSVSLFARISHADDFNAVQSGNWSDPNTWVDNTTVTNGIVPGINDSADVPPGINVTVDTNVSIGFIYDSGTVTMGTNSTLNVFQDSSISRNTALITTAPGNTVVYLCNPYDAKLCNYYNLVFVNTNYVDSSPPYNPWENFNNFSIYGPTPMTIAGDMTLIGTAKVQQGTDGPGVSSDIFIGGNLIIGAGCAWDPSGANLTVVSNVYVYGLLEDLNGALGSNYIGGNVIVAGPSTSVPSYTIGAFNGPYTNGWYVSDVTTWGIGGSLTNNGSIFGWGYGSISFDGTGIIAGSNAFTIPTMVINGTYEIGNTITLTTNYPTINGTVVFDLANTNQIVLNAGTNWFWYTTNGTLQVISSGAAPGSGKSYTLFVTNGVAGGGYGGAFSNISLPSLSPGLFWVTNLLANGSITVGGSSGSPIITLTRNGTTLSVSWNTSTYPGYQVYTLTNSAGVITNLSHSWQATGSNTSPATFTINPNSPPTFFRLRNP